MIENAKSPVFPLPLRPSELDIKNLDATNAIPLNQESRENLFRYEQGLFDRLKEIKKSSVVEHVLYLDPLTSDQGQNLFTNIYLHWSEIETEINTQLKQSDLNTEDKEISTQIWSSVFLDLLENTDASAKDDSNVHFKNLNNLLKKFNIDIPIVIPLFQSSEKLNPDQITDIFFRSDLKKIPKEIRNGMNQYTSDLAKQLFKDSLIKNNFNYSETNNPQRISRIINPQNLDKRIQELRQFKKDIKHSLSQENLSLPERAILEIYRQYINVNLAEDLSLKENKPKNFQRFDRFINGVDKNFKTLSEDIIQTANENIDPLKTNETYEKYNQIKVDSDLAQKIIEVVIKEYGWDQLKNPWKIVIRSTDKSTLGIEPKKREIRIPKNFNRGLVDTLSVIAHELEGHVLVHNNSELTKTLQLISQYGLSRGDVLKEAAAMYVEQKTRFDISGITKDSEPYYALAIQTKQMGGSFRDCFKTIFDSYQNKNQNFDFETCFNYAYDRTLRIFRGYKSLNDTSKFVNNSDQLKYIEESLVTKRLKQKGLEKIIFINGLDLNSIPYLIQLGLIDFDKIELPKMIISKKVWPKIKSQIDEGQKINI